MRNVVLLALLAASFLAAQNRPQEGEGDGFYTMFSSNSGVCTPAFVDIAGTGTPLVFSAPYASPDDPAPGDDGGAVLHLPWTYPFYGTPRGSVVVSPNGYLAFAASLQEEDGRDFSPDEALPAVPSAYFPSLSPHLGAGARLLPFHQDLDASTGGVLAASFDPCPRFSEALGSEPCSVVQWENVYPAAGGPPLRFQVLLYHHSGEFVFQYAVVDPAGGASATIGFQEDGARRGFAWSAKTPGAVENGFALCGFARDFPAGGPQADGEAFLAATPPEPMDTTPFPLELFLVNSGPSSAPGVVGHLTLPSGLALVNDPCGVTSGWSVGVLPPLGSAECTVTVQADGAFPGGHVVFHLTSDAVDPQPGNNTATLALGPADDGDGVAASLEDSYPGGDGFPRFGKGDGNGDGIADRQQRDVATLPLASGKGWVTVEVSGCTALQQVATVTEAGLPNQDPLYDFPTGLVQFTLPCPAATVKLLFHFVNNLSRNYRAFGSMPGWDTIPATWVRDRLVWGVVLQLVEGSAGDTIAGDGRITHLGGPGVLAAYPGRR